MPFYVELPADKFGNTSLPTVVVEGHITRRESSGHDYLTFTAPADFAAQWHGQNLDAFGGWKEVDGPARLITRNEHRALVGLPPVGGW